MLQPGSGREVHRVGVLGGSFDPIHIGHLIAAECARDALGLDLVLFVPAQRSPLKEAEWAAAAHRLAMVQLAIAGQPCFALSTVDLDRPPPSYTVDTLALLCQRHPRASFWFILGYDAYLDLHRWRDVEAILRLAELVVVNRPRVLRAPGVDVAGPFTDDHPTAGWHTAPRVRFLESPAIGISSTDIRQRVRAGRTITYQVPAAVERYIATHCLYCDRRSDDGDEDHDQDGGERPHGAARAAG